MTRQVIIGSLGLLWAISPVQAGDIGWPETDPFVHQPPTQTGGPASDTLFEIAPGQSFSQRLAENILLMNSAQVRRVKWWGFYDLDNPPVSESFRVRFYDARPSDGLPGEVLFEHVFLDPSRIATGQQVLTFVLPDEFLYQVDLPYAVDLTSGTPYWLEITQLGDIASAFRWEFAPSTGTPFAFINPNVSDWAQSPLVSDLAFQLWSVPEPYAASLLVMGWLGVRGQRFAGGMS